MSVGNSLKILMMPLMIMIGEGCFLQPTVRIEREYNFVDYDAPALRLAEPTKAYLLQKDKDGKWVPIGKGIIPAGAYIKGRAPVDKIDLDSK